MKLYGEFTSEDWMRIFGVKQKDVPHSFILHGEREHEWNLNY